MNLEKARLTKKQVRLFLWALIFLRVILLCNLDQHTYWTFDEPWNTDTAKQVLDEKQFRRTKDSFTPISIANVYLGQKLMALSPKIDKLSSYRVAGIIINQASVPLSYIFALQLGATVGAALLFAIFLGLEPNVLGHTVLAANVDGYILTWFLFLAVSAFAWFKRRDFKSLAVFGLALGLAQGVKLTSAYAVPLCLFWFFYVLRRENKKSISVQTLEFLFFSWLGLCVFYAFNKIGTPLGQIHFVSTPFQRFAARFARLPTIIPVDYLQGLDMCLQTDKNPRPVYIRNTFLLHGVWYYFLYVLLLKTPLPLLVTAIGGWLRAFRLRALKEPHLFVGIFIFFLMIYFSLFFNAQIGIRYLFPIYSFMLVGLIWFPWKKTTVLIACLWMSASLFYNWPNMIGYFNEIVPIKHHRWWHLGDSNLTWNQEWKDWPVFVSESGFPWEEVGPPAPPVGVAFYEDAITVSGILSNRQQLQVLRDHFDPIGSYWGVKLKYFLTPEKVLAEFPPIPFADDTPTAKIGVDNPCTERGWTEEKTGQKIADAPILANLPQGPHELRSQIVVKNPSNIFFELASTRPAQLLIEGQSILKLLPPNPNLSAATYSLEAGSYDMTLIYDREEQTHTTSIRAYVVAPHSTPEPLPFCVRPLMKSPEGTPK